MIVVWLIGLCTCRFVSVEVLGILRRSKDTHRRLAIVRLNVGLVDQALGAEFPRHAVRRGRSVVAFGRGIGQLSIERARRQWRLPCTDGPVAGVTVGLQPVQGPLNQ